jgi:pimeloyl-ACP methyl ester carboxylesterase
MKQCTISILVLIVCFSTYGQVKVNPNGKFFNYNGTKIYYEDTGKGEPLLLLHNFMNTADSWNPHVEVYSKQFRTIAIDMMGHGRSDIYKKNDSTFKHGDYAKIILALLDSLKLSKVNAIGASAGATILLHLNTMQPARFSVVITVGGLIYHGKQLREWITRTGLNQLMEWAKYHGPEKQEYLARAVWEFRKLYGDASFTPDILNTIKAKWLVI